MSRNNYRTKNEMRAQKCIEEDDNLFAKQLRGEAFTEEESQALVECVRPTPEEQQATTVAHWAMGSIGAVMILFCLGAIIWVGVAGYKADKEFKAEQKKLEEKHKKFWEELHRELEKEEKKKTRPTK